MSKRRKPDEDEDELEEYEPPAKVARKMTVDELVEAVTSSEDEATALGLIGTLQELFDNVIETWSVQDWLAFTRITASWSGLRQPSVAGYYIHVWRALVLRDFHCSVRARGGGPGIYGFIRNIEWLWQRKRNHPTKPYPRPSLRDFWRRTYFAANKYLHYLLGVGLGIILENTRLRRILPGGVVGVALPSPSIIPNDFRPWIEDPDDTRQNRAATNANHDSNLLGLPSMALAPHSADLSSLFVSARNLVKPGSMAAANTTSFTKWVQSRHHAFHVRLATRGMPDRFVVIPVAPTVHSVVLRERIDPDFIENKPDLRLAYAVQGTVRLTSFGREARPDTALELTPTTDAMSDLLLAAEEGVPRYFIGRAVALAEYHVSGDRHVAEHTIKTSVGLHSVDAELFAGAALHLHVANIPLAAGGDEIATEREALFLYLGMAEHAESRGLSRMRDSPFEFAATPTLFQGLRTEQLDGWPLFLQLCLTENPTELRSRPLRAGAHGYFNTLTRLFRTPPDDQAHLDPFHSMPEPPRGAMAGPPRFIIFDCRVCGSAPASHCRLDQPTLRYCKNCAAARSH